MNYLLLLLLVSIFWLAFLLLTYASEQQEKWRQERIIKRARRIKAVVDQLADGKVFDSTRTNEYTRRAFLEEILVAANITRTP